MMIKNIFFDFDGVILDSVNVKTEAFRSMYLGYGNDIAGKVVAHHLENGGISRFEKFKYYHETFLGQPINDEDIASLSNQFSSLVVDKVISSTPIPGSLDFIKNDKNYKKFVISGTPDNEIKEIVRCLGLNDYFADVLGSPVKKGVHARNCLSKFDLSSKESVFIGDAMADYQASIDNSMKFILIENTDNKHLFEDIHDISRLENLVNIEATLGAL
jgi:beta-phosphoglucomutase-like phosphatase (HAD superfamily)